MIGGVLVFFCYNLFQKFWYRGCSDLKKPLKSVALSHFLSLYMTNILIPYMFEDIETSGSLVSLLGILI
jgi:hypothetical protein